MRLIPPGRIFAPIGLTLASATLLLASAEVNAQQQKNVAATKIVITKVIEKACQSAQVEAELLNREQALLGQAHAGHHAHMRQHQCEVERGVRDVPAKNIAISGPDSLLEDNAAKKAIIDRNNIKNKTGFVSVALMATTTTTTPIETTIGRWSTPFIIPVVGVTAVLLNTGL